MFLIWFVLKLGGGGGGGGVKVKRQVWTDTAIEAFSEGLRQVCD